MPKLSAKTRAQDPRWYVPKSLAPQQEMPGHDASITCVERRQPNRSPDINRRYNKRKRRCSDPHRSDPPRAFLALQTSSPAAIHGTIPRMGPKPVILSPFFFSRPPFSHPIELQWVLHRRYSPTAGFILRPENPHMAVVPTSLYDPG